MDILLLIIGVIAGTIIGFLVGNSKTQTVVNDLNNRLTEKDTLLNTSSNKIQEYQNQLQQTHNKLESLNQAYNEIQISLAQKSTELKTVQLRLEEVKKESAELQQQLKVEFKNIANEIIKEQSKDLSEHNQTILKPFKSQLESFEKAVNEQMKDSIARASSFKEQIEQLRDLNNQISQDANNLTNALKGDNKFQGNWGELILEKILENSGLEKNTEYSLQVSLENVDNSRIQPDAVVYLPDDKHIVIDSKVSLVAYERYVNANSEEERQQNLKAHILSVKNHIKLLSEKKYQTAKTLSSPDFILLFIPIESSFGVAVKEDVDIFNYAWNKNIVIVSPSTLLATLKTVASLWKQEKQNKNVLRIAEESGKLYDKFVGFVDDLSKIEKSLERTSKEFGEAQKKLHSGKGNIVSRIEKIKNLGAKATKQLDSDLLED